MHFSVSHIFTPHFCTDILIPCTSDGNWLCKPCHIFWYTVCMSSHTPAC